MTAQAKDAGTVGSVARRVITSLTIGLLLAVWAVATPSAALAARTGQACLFSAPSGVTDLGFVGHIGWAFQSDTDTWVYGATEGSGGRLSIEAGGDNNTWIRTGTWADVKFAFGSGQNGDPDVPDSPVGYYTEYKCKFVENPSPLLAYNAALATAEDGYFGWGNNCLTKAVDILRAYGLTDMQDAKVENITPNSYFDTLPVAPGQWHEPYSLSILTAADVVISRIWTEGTAEQTVFTCGDSITLVLELSNPNPVPVTHEISFLADRGDGRLHYEERTIAVPVGTSRHAATFTAPATASGSYAYTADVFPADGRAGSDASRPFTIECADRPQAPVITQAGSYREGVLIYLSLRFVDADGDATGFGFRGVNGSGWAEENHPFTAPSYGRVSPGQLDYPFNHACGTDQAYESDVQAWVVDSAGRRSEPVTVHLACS